MGPLGSPIAHIGVQLTDSAYVAASMRIMTRMGTPALEVLGRDGAFVPCIHSVGAPLADGDSRYVAAAFPSACGKTNLAMIVPTIAGWRAETIGDDICWMKFGDGGRLRAINPEYGMFGVAPGTGADTNPNALRALERNTIFTNVAHTDDGDVWWEGLSGPSAHLVDWRGDDWTPSTAAAPAAHPNSRFTAPLSQVPSIAPEWEDPDGVPISAILFGGRRASVVPLVTEAFDWAHGVFLGSIMASETTAVAAGAVGDLRRDPFAMLPFCGYHMADYFAHWLDIGRRADQELLPRLFYVNWFRKDDQGRFLWPGYGDNARVLAWIFERCAGTADAVDTPIGRLPAPGGLPTGGLDLDTTAALTELLRVDAEAWRAEIPLVEQHYATFGDRLPEDLRDQLDELAKRLAT